MSQQLQLLSSSSRYEQVAARQSTRLRARAARGQGSGRGAGAMSRPPLLPVQDRYHDLLTAASGRSLSTAGAAAGPSTSSNSTGAQGNLRSNPDARGALPSRDHRRPSMKDLMAATSEDLIDLAAATSSNIPNASSAFNASMSSRSYSQERRSAAVAPALYP